ncbi:MAG: GDP-mannose 4,6-dehydratase, partial [Candidatus Parcubacteria bacterium]|nr:GDP-mannose 4,6-dehydratase [Candidatus Parcubacteria bacterium]
MKYNFGRKNILVTGGAGFLGSHLCELLIKENNIICLDDFLAGGGDVRNIEYLLRHPNFRFVKQNVNQPLDLETITELKEFKIEIQGIQEIYHLACPTTAKNFMQMRLETLWANSVGMVNILEVAKKYKAKFLLASSSVVYGAEHGENPYYKESDFGSVNPDDPRACYDEGKRFAETCAMTYHEAIGLDTKIARIFRTYGPRLALFDGQMISDFILQALNNKDLIIYGDENFSTSLCYVDDVITGMVMLMASLETGPINLGQPEQYRLSDVAKKIIQVTGSQSKVVFRPPLPFMRPLGLPDITLAKTKLNWFPV